ncbi:MAG: DUF362 domain-containing protein [Methanosarcinales archaeon]|jgi:uncharacterized Fe-S center protein|nr:DUF362 domain-containing protein [Methanosarcinales archaeon]
MASNVYFTNFRARRTSDSKVCKIKRLFKAAGFSDMLSKGDLTAVKLHFGERGNDGYINPVFVRAVTDCVKETGASPFVTDTNTLYFGYRRNAVDHIETALLHGFNYAALGVPVVIADGLKGTNEISVPVNLKEFKEVKIAADIYNADAMVVLTHFKGHVMSGFGGAVKNLAMGCASIRGKWEQHEAAQPEVDQQKCTSCGECISACPINSIEMTDAGAHIIGATCLSCGDCMICPEHAIFHDWGRVPAFIDRMTEYAYGAVKDKPGKVCYMTFVMNVTPDCDCASWSDAPIVPDIGILASDDPIALDQACYDLVNKSCGFENSKLRSNHNPGEDKFKGVWRNVDGWRQIEYGEEIGLGTCEYELIEI